MGCTYVNVTTISIFKKKKKTGIDVNGYPLLTIVGTFHFHYRQISFVGLTKHHHMLPNPMIVTFRIYSDWFFVFSFFS